jgi:hypothetical protein
MSHSLSSTQMLALATYSIVVLVMRHSPHHVLPNLASASHFVHHITCSRSTTPRSSKANLVINSDVFSSHCFVTSTFSTTCQLHQAWALVHSRIIDPLATKHSRPVLSLAKNGRGITPKVLAVGDAASAVGVLLLALILARYCSTAGNGLNEGVDAEDATPLLEHTALVLMRMSRGGCCRRQRWVVGVKRRASRRESSKGCSISDTKHVLIRGHGPGYLDELSKQEHSDPEQLKRDPNSQDCCVWVGIDELAQRRAEYIAGF